MGPIDNKPSLVQIMAWHQTGAKPLSQPLMAQFTDAYMCHRPQRVNSTMSCNSKCLSDNHIKALKQICPVFDITKMKSKVIILMVKSRTSDEYMHQ